ncbi:MAG: ATP-binding protein [Akkermansia sp.]
MIAEFSIKNFKSLQDVKLHFPEKFNILIGLNGSGKSSVLQAIDFLVSLSNPSGVSKWLQAREWDTSSLYTCLSGKRGSSLIVFSLVVDIHDEQYYRYQWDGTYNGNQEKCTKEAISWNHQDSNERGRCLSLSEGIVKLDAEIDLPPINLKPIDYKGSLLSVVKSEMRPYNIPPYDFRTCLEKILSIELLSPLQMKRRVREMSGSGVGLGGEQLPLFLHGLTDEQKQRLKTVMTRFYPHFENFETVAMRGGWKKLIVREKYDNGIFTTTESRQLNDGMLRVLAIIAETLFSESTVLIDEIEDGINPELLEKLVEYLLEDCPCQVITTSHSPLLLNFLPDEQARKGVQFVYKTMEGISRVIPFFQIPQLSESLGLLGAGEVMLQFDMEKVAEMAETMNLSV